MTVHRITPDDVAGLADRAARSVRGRANLNLHRELADPVQRLLNAFQPGTYVRPHRHVDPPRWEVFVALTGRAVVLTFDEAGRVVERVQLAADADARAVEIAGGAWHTVAALERDTVLFELKPGPYRPLDDKDFAVWAPAEHDPAAPRLAAWFATAGPGERPPA